MNFFSNYCHVYWLAVNRQGCCEGRSAHFHIVQRQHESWWMDFQSQISMRSIPPISKFHTSLHNGATKIREISFDFSFPQFFLQTISFFKSVPWNWLMVNNKISYEFKKFLAPFLISKFHTLSHENSRASKVHMYS